MKTHGLTHTPEFHAWTALKGRCLNPRNGSYHRYGGRGIKVSPLWVDDFMRFLSDVGLRPSPKHSIDRYPDNDGDYEPGNVRWATVMEQSRNRSTNRLITFRGETKTLVDWAKSAGIGVELLWWRLSRGQSLEHALTNRPDTDHTQSRGPLPDAVREKLKGRKRSAITRQRMSEGAKRRWAGM